MCRVPLPTKTSLCIRLPYCTVPSAPTSDVEKGDFSSSKEMIVAHVPVCHPFLVPSPVHRCDRFPPIRTVDLTCHGLSGRTEASPALRESAALWGGNSGMGRTFPSGVVRLELGEISTQDTEYHCANGAPDQTTQERTLNEPERPTLIRPELGS